jgi:hypothetical protein
MATAVFYRAGHVYMHEHIYVPTFPFPGVMVVPFEREYSRVIFDKTESNRVCLFSQSLSPDDFDCAERGQVESLIHRVRGIAPKAGGLRMSEKDEMAVAALDILLSDPSARDVSGLKEAVLGHPAFAGGFDLIMPNKLTRPVGCLLNSIYDITRFSNHDGNPAARLNSYFRIITPKKFLRHAHDFNAGMSYDELYEKYGNLHTLVDAFMECAGPYFPVNNDNFLSFECQYYIGHYMDRGVDKGTAVQLAAWRSVLMFLSFLKWAWMDGLRYVKFNPDKFFRDPITATLYRHLRKLN